MKVRVQVYKQPIEAHNRGKWVKVEEAVDIDTVNLSYRGLGRGGGLGTPVVS
jgi:hypothetical protein